MTEQTDKTAEKGTKEASEKKSVSKPSGEVKQTVRVEKREFQGERNERPRRGKRIVRREDRSEFDQKIVSIRRVTRVVAGGRRFSFSVVVIVGDRKGKVGVGIGKAGDTALAIEKSVRVAKKNMLKVVLTKKNSIPHDVSAKYCASCVTILPASGKGMVAGSSVRTVLELAGVKDVTAKIFSRSKNQLNNARAAMLALSQLKAR